jgi:hypothetical protein
MVEHCKEKSRLAGEFTRAAEAYSRAAKELQAAIHGDLTKALEDIQRASLDCAKARRALQTHMLEHRC